MRQAIGGAWVYATVLVFMVILIAYVTISINYANAYELSEEIIKVIEQYEGYNQKSRKKIAGILGSNTHTVQGPCQKKQGEKVLGGKDETYSKELNDRFDYCIKQITSDSDGTKRYYYETTIFFSFNIPVLGDIFTFNILGSTAGMSTVYDDAFKDL